MEHPTVELLAELRSLFAQLEERLRGAYSVEAMIDLSGGTLWYSGRGPGFPKDGFRLLVCDNRAGWSALSDASLKLQIEAAQGLRELVAEVAKEQLKAHQGLKTAVAAAKSFLG